MTLENGAPLGLALLGLLLGMRHATDPDHVIAVTAILSRERRIAAATRIGFIWGLGHTTTVLAVGAAIIVFKVAIPARVGLALEFSVAMVLIALGLAAPARLIQPLLRRGGGAPARARKEVLVHSHRHAHEGSIHRHPHVHADERGSDYASTDVPLEHDHALASVKPPFVAQRSLLMSFGVGLVHGLAGSAAIALLVLSAIPQPLWATLYLAVFCVGTILGMALITTAIGAPFVVASSRMARFHYGLVVGSGLLSLGFGCFLAYQIGVVDHLFRGVPLWTPR